MATDLKAPSPAGDRDEESSPGTTAHHGLDARARAEGDADGDGVVERQSKGVRQMEYLNSRIDLTYRILLYAGFTLLAYVMSLDQYTSSAYLTTATSVSFSAHSTLATVRTLKAVFQAVSQPPIAKVADVAGRVEAYCLCVFLYALGYVVVASSQSIYAYAVGSSINVLGITGLFLLQNIVIADISSLRNRLFWSILPSLPGAINVWISGNVVSGVLATSSWRWGYGMFCILTPVLATPIIVTLSLGLRKTSAAKLASAHSHPAAARPLKTRAAAVFWQLDLIGLGLLVAGFGLLLVTITIANGRVSRWDDAHSIAMLVIGAVLTVAFVLWERLGARHPLLPFKLMRDRTVVAALLIALWQPMTGGIVNGYFLTYLRVAANQSNLSATRISSITSFTATLTAVCAGVVVRYLRYLKPIIALGFCIEMLGVGLMIRYRRSDSSQVELAMVQVVRGIGSGCISFPTQAAIQSAASHEHVALITASWLMIFYISQGIGAAIGGGIWTNLVPDKMGAYFADIGSSSLAASAYGNPIGFIAQYPPGTPERVAIARAHDETQRVIVIVGTCVAALGLVSTMLMRTVRLPDTQSIVKSDGKEVEQEGGVTDGEGKRGVDEKAGRGRA